jgi:hypothetical protein
LRQAHYHARVLAATHNDYFATSTDRLLKAKLNVAAFTGGRSVPSARFRVRQYITELMHYGISVEEMPAALSVYPPNLRALRIPWACATLAQRIPSILRSYSYDVVLLQREMLSTYATLESMTGKPRVLDVDDAIYLLSPRRFAERLAQLSDLVICGNSFLADFFSRWNRRVAIVPTGVDTQHYVPRDIPVASTARLIIGWIGTSANLPYLLNIESALAKVLKLVPSARIHVISDRKPQFRNLDEGKVNFIKWSMENDATRGIPVDERKVRFQDAPIYGMWRARCSISGRSKFEYLTVGLLWDRGEVRSRLGGRTSSSP